MIEEESPNSAIQDEDHPTWSEMIFGKYLQNVTNRIENSVKKNHNIIRKLIINGDTNTNSERNGYFIGNDYFTTNLNSKNFNSSYDLSEADRRHYAFARKTIADVSNYYEESFDSGAIKTALHIVSQLENYKIAPPEISWHSGDSIVLIWSIGTATTAITVTDGELGYVIRRDKKRLKIAHSIELKKFSFLELEYNDM